jgi:hypothetical protein
VITISQDYVPSGLPADLAPGQINPSLAAAGSARLSADRMEAGGFGNISLSARDMFVFDGPVTLTAGRSISLSRGILTSADATSPVTLNAPYVLLNGLNINTDEPAYINNGVWTPSTKTNSIASFTVNADLIDFQNTIKFGVHASIMLNDGSISTVDGAGFANVNFNSQGDIRFGNTSVTTPGNLAFSAAQLYPLTGATATVVAGETLSVGRNGGDAPQLPYSVFGNLSLSGAEIDQGGIIRAPLGLIALDSGAGVVNLKPGSITSVSAAGLTIPYGGTTDGVSYNYNGTAVTFTDSTGRPTAAVSLLGQSVNVESGAVLDLSGGGNVTGAGFISGRGGSVDVLTTALANANPANSFSAPGNAVYAIMPGWLCARGSCRRRGARYRPADHGPRRCAGAGGRHLHLAAGALCVAAGRVPGRDRQDLDHPVQRRRAGR